MDGRAPAEWPVWLEGSVSLVSVTSTGESRYRLHQLHDQLGLSRLFHPRLIIAGESGAGPSPHMGGVLFHHVLVPAGSAVQPGCSGLSISVSLGLLVLPLSPEASGHWPLSSWVKLAGDSVPDPVTQEQGQGCLWHRWDFLNLRGAALAFRQAPQVVRSGLCSALEPCQSRSLQGVTAHHPCRLRD